MSQEIIGFDLTEHSSGKETKLDNILQSIYARNQPLAVQDIMNNFGAVIWH